MAKTRSNKRPTTTNTTLVADNKASLGNTTTTSPTNALNTVGKTRTRSKKCKEGVSDEKPHNVIINKKNSKINLSTIESTHNTRRRSLNNKNTKNAADMDTANMDSSLETGTENNEINSPEYMSDNEQEVIKVIEIVDESQSYNLHEDDEEDDGKEYELVYVEDGEEGDGEIEYLNEEYLLDDDFIIQEQQQNEDSLQNSIVIESDTEDCTMDSLSQYECTASEVDSSENIEQGTVVSETAKVRPIVPMATRSRRSHVIVVDSSSEKSKSKRKSKLSEKNSDGDVKHSNKIFDDSHEIKKESETRIMESISAVSESIKIEEIPKPKVFIPNIEPPATRARSRKSITNSDSTVTTTEPIKNQLIKNPLEEINILKSPVPIKIEKENCVNDSESEKVSPNTSNVIHSIVETLHENPIQDTSLSESKSVNVETLTKNRKPRRVKVLSISSLPESNKSVLIGNKEITKLSNNEIQPILSELDESTKEINQKIMDEVSLKLQNSEEENLQKLDNIILESIEREKSINLIPITPTATAQPAVIRTTRLSQAKILKPDLESSVENLKFKPIKNSNNLEESEQVKGNTLEIEMITNDKKIEENDPPPEFQVKSSKIENDHDPKCELKLERAAESIKTIKKKQPIGSDMTTEVTSTNMISEDNKIIDYDPNLPQNTKIMEGEIENNAVEIVTNEKDAPSGLRKLRRKSRKDSSPPHVSQIELNESSNSLQQITSIKSFPEITENTENTIKASELDNGLGILNSNIEITSTSNPNCEVKMDETEEYKNSQEGKSGVKTTSSRSQLAYTSIISTRRQKKDQIKSESLKPLEKISDNCMAIVEKLLQESSINKPNAKLSVDHVIESNLSKAESPKMKTSDAVELKPDMAMETDMELENVAEFEKMVVEETNPIIENLKQEIEFKEPLEYCLEEKFKNIKLHQIKGQPEPEQHALSSNELEPNSTKIKEFETKINRNFYAEAFAGLSHETRTHIFEALLRSKADTKSATSKEAAKEESIEFDDKKNIGVKKKSNKKIKKSSKKERKIDKNEIPGDDSKVDDDESLRRSSRIKTISQTRQRSHGHGLVKARDPFRDMDDDMDEENSNCVKYKALEIDGTETKDCVPSEETEVKLKREREMILRLKQFTTIKENIYHCDKNISKEAKKMTCDCFLTKEEIERGELGCGEDCLNRLLMIECGPKCVVAERCTNRKFQKTQYANCKVFQTEKKGFGIMAAAIIPPGEFIMEYIGEVLNSEQFEKRADDYSKDKNKHYYFMALRSDAVIDATAKGNISRFINHSCDPNAETQKWTVNGELRIGFFSTRAILKGEEITFDYQFQRYGKEAQKCYCEASNCRGWIGEEPDSADDDDDDEEEEEEDEVEEQPQPPQVEKLENITPILSVPITEIKEITTEEITSPATESSISAPKEIAEETIPPLVPELLESPSVVVLEKIKKPTKKERKALVKTRKTRSELLEDADLEEEINILNRTGLKNQAHTLKLSRLMVRAKLMNARVRLIQLLQSGELPCRRLFLDYHGLRLLHGWMSDSTAASESLENVKFQLKLLDTLKVLPIPNKTMLKDSKVINLVQKWSLDDKKTAHYSPNDDTPSDSGSGTPIQQIDSPNHVPSQSSIVTPQTSVSSAVADEYSYVSKNIIKMSVKLIENWENLPEVFRIPKKERIEQMKEHEREADLRYQALGLSEDPQDKIDRYPDKNWERETQRNRDKKLPYNNNGNNINNVSNKPTNSSTPQLDKYQRRQIFEMKFAKEQEEKKKQEYWRLHEMTCTCFRLDPRKTAQEDVPAIVNPATGQWYTKEMKPVPTPPSHAHIKPPEQVLSTNPDDYTLPTIDLPQHWKFAIDTKGRIYYYHVKIRIPQWEPPIFLPPLAVAEEIKPSVESKDKTVDADKESSSTDTTDSSEDELKERINNLKQRFKERGQPLPEINITDSELVESLDVDAKNKDNFSDTFPRIDPVKSSYKINKRKRRREGLVQERIISPRTEEDKMYGQQQSRMYRETKEKLRRRKEEMRKRRLLETGSSSMRNNKILKLTDGLPVSISPYDSDESDDESEQSYRRSNDSANQNDPDNAVDFVESLISHNMSDNDARLLDGLKEIGKEKVNKKNVYEEWKKQQAKLKSDARKRELNQNKLIQSTSASSSTGSSSSSHVKRRKVVMDNIDLSTDEIRRIKEKFRTDIAGVIVQHLGPYRKDSCKIGRILHDEDFKHLARKLTHFVMLKELKHCDNTVNILEVTDSVKIKSREFIKKYMTKYGAIYRRGENEPDYKD